MKHQIILQYPSVLVAGCRYTHPPRRVEIGLAGQVTPQHEEEH